MRALRFPLVPPKASRQLVGESFVFVVLRSRRRVASISVLGRASQLTELEFIRVN